MANEITVDCSALKEIRIENHTRPIDAYKAIDDFTNDLNVRLKNLDGGQAMVAATSFNNLTGQVIHQTLELTPNHEESIDGFDVEVTTVDATPAQGRGAKLYHWLAEHSALWTEGGDTISEVRDVPDHEQISVGVGSINNTMYLTKVRN